MSHRRSIRPLLAVLAMVCCTVALAGCGPAAGTSSTTGRATGAGACVTPQPTGNSGQNTGTITPAGTVTISRGISASPLATATSSAAGAPVTAKGDALSGSVAITIAQRQFAQCDTIQATIVNGLGHAIYATDHHASCTLLTVQRRTPGNVWQHVGTCVLMTPTRIVQIPPGATLAQRLAPGNGYSAGNGWEPGTYRLMLAYFASNDATGVATPVYSPTFTVS